MLETLSSMSPVLLVLHAVPVTLQDLPIFAKGHDLSAFLLGFCKSLAYFLWTGNLINTEKQKDDYHAYSTLSLFQKHARYSSQQRCDLPSFLSI